jgi:5'-methylthioadenosine phosphorylase
MMEDRGQGIGVIGGSGLYEWKVFPRLRAFRWTPFGAPSRYLHKRRFCDGRSHGILPRHGRGHRSSSFRSKLRANIYGMRNWVVTRLIFSVSAVGSMKEEIALDIS